MLRERLSYNIILSSNKILNVSDRKQKKKLRRISSLPNFSRGQAPSIVVCNYCHSLTCLLQSETLRIRPYHFSHLLLG